MCYNLLGNISIIRSYVLRNRLSVFFGSFDENIKLIEREFGVRITCRDSELKIEGDVENAAKARTVIESLLQFLSRGEALSEQNIRYCISLVKEGSEEKIEELAGDCICITSKGKPIKPKTIGQKRYCKVRARPTSRSRWR